MKILVEMKKKILALVLARKNSTRLKNKNILILKNKPLISWTFDFLKIKKFAKILLMYLFLLIQLK